MKTEQPACDKRVHEAARQALSGAQMARCEAVSPLPVAQRVTVIASGTGGVRLDAGERRRARYAYDAAELRFIAARALLKAAETDAEADGWPTEALEAVAAEREAMRSAERNLESAREECEQAGVIINAHPALSIL